MLATQSSPEFTPAAGTIAERMASVILRLAGRDVDRRDFRRASETCDLTDGQLDAHIDAAASIATRKIVRHDQPATPVHPWEMDWHYRIGRIRLAADLLMLGYANEGEAIAALRDHDRFSARELGALLPEIVTELGLRTGGTYALLADFIADRAATRAVEGGIGGAS